MRRGAGLGAVVGSVLGLLGVIVGAGAGAWAAAGMSAVPVLAVVAAVGGGVAWIALPRLVNLETVLVAGGLGGGIIANIAASVLEFSVSADVQTIWRRTAPDGLSR